MSRQKRSIGQDTLLTPKPFTRVMLDDVDGGQEGLLPLSTQGKPLKIEFEPWNNTDPSPQEPESVELFWDGQPVDTKTWTAPIAPDDYYIDVPPSFLTNGRHEVHYLLTMYTGQTEPSDVRVLTVDIDPPRLNANSKLQFDTSVISIDYLIGTGDVAVATVPAYTTAAPGDVVIATWKNLAGGTSDELRTAPLTHLDYMNPIKLTFTGEFIRNMGDGEREVTYRVQDRAFNLSAESTAAQLLVAAIRPERVTPYPWVVEIGGTPQNWGALDPLRAQGGATVRIPAAAVYYQEDGVEVQFGEPGTAFAVTVPVPWQTRDVLITKEQLPPYFNKTLPVYYVVHLPDGTSKASDRLTLEINGIASSRFSPPQLGEPHTSPVFKKNIPSTGLPIIQRPWAFISTQCLISITVNGTGTDNQPKTEKVLDKRPVTSAQVTAGVPAAITKAFMESLRNGGQFTVLTQCSYDRGESWFSFTVLRPVLQA
ncbi:hypothetical protein NYP20_16670 [Pseudomonas sp. N3-W]|uniref:hypothetical protein n=1 Tax=Pseudomonas sp. N3-W TaxID=2975049 RepID=UPI00217D5C26|nr:hypothetical protein [Pseudomonas sp. N3-W]UWF46982.1 hypothetical protein NYP20_16670 [Pseudomonas sp. N3-W]